ncbi:MAG: hypothetical protein HUJ73_07485, partial [Eubacterium sp.]|nr:hypothetical protein [Eubacterium sp.]
MKVNFLEENKTIDTKGGETLLALMRRSGLSPDAPCGGNGTCEKCRALIRRTGKPDEIVKSCSFIIEEDLEVLFYARTEDAAILTEGQSASDIFSPVVKQQEVIVPPCPDGQSLSCEERLSSVLDGSDLRIPPDVISALSALQGGKGGPLWAVRCGDDVLSISPEKKPVYMAAFDIGTTTVAGWLLNGEDGSEAAVSSRLNPQTRFGADVISRAGYTVFGSSSSDADPSEDISDRKEGSDLTGHDGHSVSGKASYAGNSSPCENISPLEEMSVLIRRCLSEMLAEMIRHAGIPADSVYAVSIAGNTCMHHFFLGIAVDSLIRVPYCPALSRALNLRAADYLTSVHKNARLLMLPNIAGFVGADTTACLVSSRLADKKDWTLLID